MSQRLTIAITQGDPGGIGPELAVRTAHRFAEDAEIVLYGTRKILENAVAHWGTEAPFMIIDTDDSNPTDWVIGKDCAENGRRALQALDRATRDVIDGKCDALVTAPMSKHAVNLCGVPFQGHTEYIADLCGVKNPIMMQSAAKYHLHVAFATTHIPLSRVAEQLSSERVFNVICELHKALRELGKENPRIAVCALNPHAGENGNIGKEESTLILPAIEQARASGIHVEGPKVPDVIFMESQRCKFDGIVSLYHDQGHIPFKMLAFDCGVNSTLGIPIIRTSPDHGVAYDIAWQGIADPGSMFAATQAAIARVRKRQKS